MHDLLLGHRESSPRSVRMSDVEEPSKTLLEPEANDALDDPDSPGLVLDPARAVENLDVIASDAPGWADYLRALGPGLVTGASDDDPSGIATYAQTGARFGFGMLWVAIITFPLMAAVQEICDRTALATGKDLGELMMIRFGRIWRVAIAALIAALIIANTLNIAADLVAVGSGMHLLHAGPGALWAVVAGVVIMILLVSGSFATIARVFKILSAALLAYIVVLVTVKVPWGTVLFNTVVPHVEVNRTFVALLVGVLGTTISPYLFFWQSMHRIEDMREEDAGGSQPLPLRRRSRIDARGKQSRSRFDVFTGMAFSNVVMFAIITVTAVTLTGKSGHHVTISSAAQAASALRPVAGRFATAIFALGFVGAGMLAIPVLAGAGSAGMAGILGKPTGFSNSPRQAPVFYGLCAIGTVGGMALSLLSVNPITLLVFVAVVNGVAAAPFIIITMIVSSNPTIMGEYVNGRAAKLLGWLAAALMTGAAVALFATGGV
jgi:NRAMP (natural resistance-associated macrophage protein)-like metal ion transporter